MRFLAFLAALAGLVTITGQGAAIVVATVFQDRVQLVPYALMVAAGGELAFYVLLVLMLLGFAFTRRRA